MWQARNLVFYQNARLAAAQIELVSQDTGKCILPRRRAKLLLEPSRSFRGGSENVLQLAFDRKSGNRLYFFWLEFHLSPTEAFGPHLLVPKVQDMLNQRPPSGQASSTIEFKPRAEAACLQDPLLILTLQFYLSGGIHLANGRIKYFSKATEAF